MLGNFYQVDSPLLLDAEALKVVQHWRIHLKKGEIPSISHQELVEAFRNRKALARMLRTTREDLKKFDPILLTMLLPYQRDLLEKKLVRAHYLHMLQARIDEIEYRWDGLKLNYSACAYYEDLFFQLSFPFLEKRPDPALQLNQLNKNSEKPLAYFGARVIAPVFAISMLDICAGKMGAIKSLLVDLDKKDVYLGWSRSFILSVFNLIPTAFQHESTLHTHVQAAGPYLSYLNMIVVNTCFAIEVFLLMKNTFLGALALRREKIQINLWEQFSTQLNQRKFVLLNWLFLSVMHIAAFLCLSGVIQVWPWGPIFSVGCRLVQLALMSARYDGEFTQYKANEHRIMQQLIQLEENLTQLSIEYNKTTELYKKDQLHHAITMIEMEISSMLCAQRRVDADWNLKHIELMQHSIFTSCFFSGVMLFSCLIFPAAIIAPPIALSLGVAGATICFTSIVVMSMVRANQAMERTRTEILSIHLSSAAKLSEADQALLEYMRKFITCKRSVPTRETELEMKQLYLLMNQVVSHSITQTQLLHRQRVELWVNLARDVFVPIFTLAVLLFFPTGLGLGLIGALVLVSLFSKVMIERFTPISQHSLKFDEKTYEEFKEDPNMTKLNQFYKQINSSLFSKTQKDQPEEDYLSDFDFDAGPSV